MFVTRSTRKYQRHRRST